MDKNYNALTSVLPEKGVLFLGGHQNMVKKLKQRFPKWIYISEDKMRHYPNNTKHRIVFYWTNHTSHSITERICKKLSEDTVILYVTATNIPLLITEMQNNYQTVVS